jgi:hypothetical protein
MGRDFDIRIYLEIEHKHGTSYYELPCVGGYFFSVDCGHGKSDGESDCDSNHDSIESAQQLLYDNMKQLCLTPRKPVILYKDNEFVSKKIEKKYLPILLDKFYGKYVEQYCVNKDTGFFTNISEIITVTKKEIRYELGEGPWLHLSA